MAEFGLAGYVEAEIEAMRRFRGEQTKISGKRITANEAAMLWVTSGRAQQFSEEHTKEHQDGR